MSSFEELRALIKATNDRIDAMTREVNEVITQNQQLLEKVDKSLEMREISSENYEFLNRKIDRIMDRTMEEVNDIIDARLP